MALSVPSLEKKQLLSGVDDLFLPFYDRLLTDIAPDYPYLIQQVVIARTIDRDLEGKLVKVDWETDPEIWYQHLSCICSALYTYLARECNRVVMLETLKVTSVIVGSWIMKNLDIMSGIRNSPFFNKNLAFYIKSERAQSDFLEKLYWYIRLTRCRLGTEITDNGNVFWFPEEVIPEGNNPPVWSGNTLLFVNGRHMQRGSSQSFLSGLSKFFLFTDKHPIIFMGHVSQVPSDSQRHRFAAEFVV